MLATSLINLYLRVTQAIWRRLPLPIRDSRLGRRCGMFLHRLVCRRANRHQYFGTFFLRNRPVLEQIRRLSGLKADGSSLRIAILGCSIGAEIYSVLWAIRSTRPNLKVHVCALDNSGEVLDVAAKATYTSDASALVGESIFERLTERELHEMFEWEGDKATVRPWIREGISWHLGDACDPELIRLLGAQDIVLANNFLCHMEPAAAEACLRHIARLVDRGGHLVVLGVDLDVRAKVARELGWQPIPNLIREMHDGDPSVRRDWPWQWWGLEPLDDRRADWQLRYAVAYRINQHH